MYTGKKPHVLEVYPQAKTDGGKQKYQVRIKGGNGKTRFFSGPEGYSKSAALAAAKSFNTEVCGGKLSIRVLDKDGLIVRFIESGLTVSLTD